MTLYCQECGPEMAYHHYSNPSAVIGIRCPCGSEFRQVSGQTQDEFLALLSFPVSSPAAV